MERDQNVSKDCPKESRFIFEHVYRIWYLQVLNLDPKRKFRSPGILPGNPVFSRIPGRKIKIFQEVKRWVQMDLLFKAQNSFFAKGFLVFRFPKITMRSFFEIFCGTGTQKFFEKKSDTPSPFWYTVLTFLEKPNFFPKKNDPRCTILSLSDPQTYTVPGLFG